MYTNEKVKELVKKEIRKVCMKEELHVPQFVEFVYDDNDNVENVYVFGVPSEEKSDIRKALLTRFKQSRYSSELKHIVGDDGIDIVL